MTILKDNACNGISTMPINEDEKAVIVPASMMFNYADGVNLNPDAVALINAMSEKATVVLTYGPQEWAPLASLARRSSKAVTVLRDPVHSKRGDFADLAKSIGVAPENALYFCDSLQVEALREESLTLCSLPGALSANNLPAMKDSFNAFII